MDFYQLLLLSQNPLLTTAEVETLRLRREAERREAEDRCDDPVFRPILHSPEVALPNSA